MSGGNIYKDYAIESEDDDTKEESSLDFEVPDTTALQKSLLQSEHIAQMEEEDKKGKGKRKPKQRQGGTICFCGHPGCRIGHFVETAT